MKILNYTIGSDFEVFLQDKSGKIITAEGIIKGSKYEPFNFDPLDRFAATSLDNVLAEACIAPAKDRICFIGGINKGMDYIKSILPDGVSIAAIPSAILSADQLTSENALLFGCEPDFNVWKQEPNERPLAENSALRSAGFHVHFGYDNPDQAPTERLVKAMDLLLGVPAILIEPENERRKLYGKAGSFRFKDYGGEYRTLSGYFGSNDTLTGWVFDQTEKAIDMVNNGGNEEIDSIGDIIQTAINTSNKTLAGNLIRQFNMQMP